MRNNNSTTFEDFVKGVKSTLEGNKYVSRWSINVNLRSNSQRDPLPVKTVTVEIILGGKEISFKGIFFFQVLDALKEFFNKERRKGGEKNE